MDRSIDRERAREREISDASSQVVSQELDEFGRITVPASATITTIIITTTNYYYYYYYYYYCCYYYYS